MAIKPINFEPTESFRLMRDGKLVDVPRDELTPKEWQKIGEMFEREVAALRWLNDTPNHGPVIVFRGGAVAWIPPEAISDKDKVLFAIVTKEPDELSAKQGIGPDTVLEFRGGKRVTIPPEAVDGDDVYMNVVGHGPDHQGSSNQPTIN